MNIWGCRVNLIEGAKQEIRRDLATSADSLIGSNEREVPQRLLDEPPLLSLPPLRDEEPPLLEPPELEP